MRVLACALLCASLVGHESGAQTLSTATRFRVRLLDAVSSEPKGIGQRVNAVVMRSVEEAGVVALPAGTRIAGIVRDGGVLRAHAQQRYVDLAFTDVIVANGTSTPFRGRVVAIENARETVDSLGRLLGPPMHGFAKSASTWAMMALGLVEPIPAIVAIAAFRGAQHELHRDIHLPAGTDLTIELEESLRVADAPVVTERALASAISSPTRIDTLLAQLPRRAVLRLSGPYGDFVNVVMIGSRAQLDSAFVSAGWTTAQRLSARSDLRTFASAVRGSGYSHQPVSQQLLFDRPPDVVYQRVVNTFAKRHHIRIWQSPRVWNGQPVWVAAATNDVGLALSLAHRGFTHRIAPEIDEEREIVVDDLSIVNGVEMINRHASLTPPFDFFKARVESDGQIAVMTLRSTTARDLRFTPSR